MYSKNLIECANIFTSNFSEFSIHSGVPGKRCLAAIITFLHFADTFLSKPMTAKTLVNPDSNKWRLSATSRSKFASRISDG